MLYSGTECHKIEIIQNIGFDAFMPFGHVLVFWSRVHGGNVSAGCKWSPQMEGVLLCVVCLLVSMFFC